MQSVYKKSHVEYVEKNTAAETLLWILEVNKSKWAITLWEDMPFWMSKIEEQGTAQAAQPSTDFTG